ncbi:RND family transporter [Algoriphagus sp. A40]|uniref:efflux RND transporter permease subunit n=1 Tax=Algoriphagus sp. A40 TaxID=1945863 RepID=UPI000985F683|nr:MMPL family transporter [Algoriphagus sp. A40]OOG71199.1 RND transporter [Algoriphagus sp. A40]
MFRKPTALAFLGIGIFLSFLILIFPPQLAFEYDFEQFFTEDDPDLAFYRQFEKDFESDNDYLLIALQSSTGEVAEVSFVEKSNLVKEKIKTLQGVDTLISILDLEMPKIGLFGISFEKVFDWESEENLKLSKSQLDQFEGSLISKDGKSILFLIKHDPGLNKEQGDSVYGHIRQIFSESKITPKAVAGKIQAQGDFVTLMQQEFGIFLSISLILMLLALWLIFRSWWGVCVPIVVLSFGVLWAFALILFSGRALDIMSVMKPTIFLIVGLSALIHYFTQLIKKLNANVPKDQAVFETFRELTFPVWLTVFTTSVGFLSLYFTSIPALKAFGLWTGIGILVIFLALIFITPGVLYLVPLSKNKTAQLNPISALHTLFSQIILKRKVILLGFLGLTVISLGLGTQLKVNGYLLDNLPHDHPIQQDISYFDEQFGGSNPLEIYLEAGNDSVSLLDFEVLQEIEKLELKLLEAFGERQYISPLSLVKTLNQAQNQGSPAAFTFPSQGQYLRMKRYFSQLLKTEGPKVISSDQKSGRMSSRVADLGSLEMGKRRTEILDFVQKEINPGLLKVRWTGTAFLMDRGHESVTRQMLQGLFVAFLVVGIIGGLMFRSLRLSLILLIPNIIPLVWMLGLMFLLGIEFKLTTSILFSIAFGIAVDDTIHFMAKLKTELKKGKSFLYAIKRTFLEAGRAIILTSVILVVGFGLLSFSKFGVTHFTGLLISFTLIFALLADLLLLPVLLFPLKKIWERKPARGLKA